MEQIYKEQEDDLLMDFLLFNHTDIIKNIKIHTHEKDKQIMLNYHKTRIIGVKKYKPKIRIQQPQMKEIKYLNRNTIQ